MDELSLLSNVTGFFVIALVMTICYLATEYFLSVVNSYLERDEKRSKYKWILRGSIIFSVLVIGSILSVVGINVIYALKL